MMDTMRSAACALVMVDYQARLMPAIHQAEAATATAVLLVLPAI
jgi:hypothetical protein